MTRDIDIEKGRWTPICWVCVTILGHLKVSITLDLPQPQGKNLASWDYRGFSVGDCDVWQPFTENVAAGVTGQPAEVRLLLMPISRWLLTADTVEMSGCKISDVLRVEYWRLQAMKVLYNVVSSAECTGNVWENTPKVATVTTSLLPPTSQGEAPTPHNSSPALCSRKHYGQYGLGRWRCGVTVELHVGTKCDDIMHCRLWRKTEIIVRLPSCDVMRITNSVCRVHVK